MAAGLDKTLTALETAVRDYLDEDTADQWTQAKVFRAINHSYWDALKIVEQLSNTRLTATANIDFQASVQEYDLETDCLAVLDVEDLTSEVPVDILPYNERYFYQTGAMTYLRSWYGATYVAYLRNGKIGFCPIPTAAATDAVKITYIQEQDQLESGDSHALPSSAKELIVLGAVKRLKIMKREIWTPQEEELLQRQEYDFVKLIEGRDATGGARFTWGISTIAGQQGFASVGDL